MHPVVDTRVPNPPGRSERKYRLSSSFDMVGVWSWHRELTGASRCTGSDHSEPAKDMAWIPRTRSLLVSVLQAASKARGISGKGRRASALVMDTSQTGGIALENDATHPGGSQDGSRHLFEVKRHGGPKTLPLRRQT